MRCFCFLLLFASLTLTGQVTSTATGDSGSGYPALEESGFQLETPDCVHSDFGPHVTQTYDAQLERNVFVFHSHIDDDNDRCVVFDRVRMEIKGSSSSIPELQHERGDTTYYRWKFRLDEDFIGASSFTHLYQNKAVGGEDSGFPILTLTARADRLEVKHSGGESGTDLGTLVEADISKFRGRWVEGYLRQVHDEDGDLIVTVRDMATGLTIMEYSNSNIDLWREGAELNRPKWGVYRSKNEVLRDEEVRFANFCVSEVAESLCPGEAVLQPDTEAPTVPTAVVVTATTFTTVALEWTAAEDTYGVVNYVVYADGVAVDTTSVTEAVIAELTTATTYSFTVAARDAAGNQSARSTAVEATTDDATALPGAATAPSPADGAEAVSPQSGLGWTAGSNTETYTVYFGTASDPPVVGEQSTSSYQPSLAPNTTYYWRVDATNQNGSTVGPVWSFTTGTANADAPWYVYRGNARPEVETTFFELNTAPEDPTLDQVVTDPDNPANSVYGYRSNTNENFRWRFDLDDQDSTITMVTRIRGIDEEASGMMHLDVRAFGWRQKVRLNSSSIKLERSSPAVEAELPFDWNADYHTVRIVVTGRTTSVYVDEQPTPLVTGESDDARDQSYFEWGKSGGDDYGAYVDWMAVNSSEASAPGTGTPLPADLVPGVNDDANWDVFRATARPEVETDFYALNNAPDTPRVDTVLADPNGSDNTYYAFRSDGDNFRWRYDLDSQDSAITIVVRLRAVDPDVNGIIYFETRAAGYRQKIRINQSSIKLERSDPAVEKDVPFNWNDELHVIRLVITGATTTVYLDEDPKPFLTGVSAQENDGSYFEWGKSGGDDYGAVIDWLAIDADTASAPGTGPALPQDLFLSSDATLSTLSVNGMAVDSFLPYRTEYVVNVAGTDPPTVSYTTTSALATATATEARAVSDTLLVTVRAQDSLTVRTYRIVTVGATSTFNPQLQQAVQVYPNPARGRFTVTLPGEELYTGRLVTLGGRTVRGAFTISRSASIDVSSLPSGIYLLVVRSAAGQSARVRILVD